MSYCGKGKNLTHTYTHKNVALAIRAFLRFKIALNLFKFFRRTVCL